MANLVETREIVSKMRRKMVAVNINFRIFRESIMTNNFNVSRWYNVNITEINEIRALMSQYQMANSRLPILIQYYEFFHFYWHHLTEYYARVSVEKVKTDIVLLDQQIDYTLEITRLCVEEITRLTLLMANRQN